VLRRLATHLGLVRLGELVVGDLCRFNDFSDGSFRGLHVILEDVELTLDFSS